MTNTEAPKGHCKHGEFSLLLGCPECIAEGRTAADTAALEEARANKEPWATDEADLYIVKVRYITVKVDSANNETPVLSGREYTYFSVDQLKVGDVVQVPVQTWSTLTAKVSAVDVDPGEILPFRDRVKTIPSGSIRPGPAREIPTTEVDLPAAGTSPVAQVAKLFDQGRERIVQAAHDEGPYGGQEWPPTESEYNKPSEALVEMVNEALDPATAVPTEDFVADPAPEIDPLSLPDSALLRGEEPAAMPPALVTIQTQVGKPAPELLQLYLEAAGLLQFAKARVIATNEDLKPATDDLAIIAKCKKAMFERKTELVGPMKAKLDLVNQAFNDIMYPVMEADRLTRGQVQEFDTKVRTQATEAKRIEDEKLRLAREEAAFTGTGEFDVPLGTVESPPPVPEHTRTGMGTLGGRANWKARVLDFAALPDAYKLPNEQLLNSFARTNKGQRPIPGVEFYDDRIVTIRTKKGES